MSAVEFDASILAKLDCLAGSLDGINNQPLLPFSDQAVLFLADLSQELLGNKAVRQYPDIVTFGYWCRKSNISKQQIDAHKNSRLFKSRIGRGLAFHIAPANVPVNFAFSFVFALLAGNSNIVRVPSKPFIQTQLITQAINAVLPKYPEIARRCAFVSYPVDDTVTAAFSEVADVRLVWGGDATIASILALPHLPRCKDVLFSDRYSIALISGSEIDKADDQQLDRLAQGFYNDTYLMDQNACTAPQMVFWFNASKATKQRFWRSVANLAKQQYLLQPRVSVDKYVQLCEDIINGTVAEKVEFDGLLTVVDMVEQPPDICHLRGAGGYFYQSDIKQLSEIAAVVTERFQTLSYFGFEQDDLRDFALNSQLRGIDRIVPIGTAMDIGLIWDGYDLVSELSRIIDVQ